ncbi:Gamma-2-syntrophin [Liparis tanakae]|uniref:Gamma-2-syntrophin n=1 Tax=Liparis tanakae TaxID=230148 RepID=A0A4Z2EHT3_9TELE|nr:Gamma-2-syntrophin [Liparis tanakae]
MYMFATQEARHIDNQCYKRTKSGIALLYNEETNNTYDVCLKLTKEVFTIQKLDVVCTSESESPVNGGAEHNVPVVISKIFKDQVGKKVFFLFLYLKVDSDWCSMPCEMSLI